MERDFIEAFRNARPRWLSDRLALTRTRIPVATPNWQPLMIVDKARISAPLDGGGSDSVNTVTGNPLPPSNPTPQTPTWPDPYPDDTDHTPLPPIDAGVDIVLAAVYGQNVGYPNSYGGFAADQAYIWNLHTDPAPYLLVDAWMIPLGAPITIGNITFWRVDIRVQTPPYDGPTMARLTHSGLSEAFGGQGPYQLYQEDYA